jgi:hypothetical protein
MVGNRLIAVIVGGFAIILGIILITRRKSPKLQDWVSLVYRGGLNSGIEFHVGGLVVIGVILEIAGVFMVLAGGFAW